MKSSFDIRFGLEFLLAAWVMVVQCDAGLKRPVNITSVINLSEDFSVADCYQVTETGEKEYMLGITMACCRQNNGECRKTGYVRSLQMYCVLQPTEKLEGMKKCCKATTDCLTRVQSKSEMEVLFSEKGSFCKEFYAPRRV